MQDIEVSESIYNEDEIRVRNEYFSLYNMLMSAESNMSDEEYEKISDKLEQYEEDYGEILKTPQNKDNIQYQAEISKLYEEKRILTRIIKNADIYGKVTESVTFEVDKAKDNISQPYIEYTQGNKDVKNI